MVNEHTKQRLRDSLAVLEPDEWGYEECNDALDLILELEAQIETQARLLENPTTTTTTTAAEIRIKENRSRARIEELEKVIVEMQNLTRSLTSTSEPEHIRWILTYMGKTLDAAIRGK